MKKRCFGSRGIRNSKGRKCEIGGNIVKCLPQNHALLSLFANAALLPIRLQPKNNTKKCNDDS